jgi:hypothetical protein
VLAKPKRKEVVVADEKDPKEITSLNKELMSFDVNDVSIEELERRLELAIGQVLPDIDFGCPTDCPVDCGVMCTTRCTQVCSSDSAPQQP